MSTLLLKKSVDVTDDVATGAAMRQKRESFRLTLRQMGQRMGVSAAFLSDLELGRKRWTEERASEYVKALAPRHESLR